jgi:hypothetical protein
MHMTIRSRPSNQAFRDNFDVAFGRAQAAAVHRSTEDEVCAAIEAQGLDTGLGVRVVENPALPEGHVELRGKDGELLGVIGNLAVPPDPADDPDAIDS